ncbi:hypothetical protein [Winogradskyella sp. 3972H.M.0a.05]|uniref:hypothetical protein n=1 Tax=Winogradskyella sp. 3972H.M.0a.05 TaxID=2950277 RepID=UPI00339B6114
MTSLNDIIKALSVDEQQRFITYLEKKNKRHDSKNIQLFKLLAKQEQPSEVIYKSLYKSGNKNAYHALRKRLLSSLIDFIANINLEEENSTDMHIIKYILASRTFLMHKQYGTAYKLLDKAEKLSLEHQLFPLLNEIYHTKIQYAYTLPELDLDDLVSKFNINQKHLYTEEQLNIVYAKIRRTLARIKYKGEVINFQKLLNKTLEEHQISMHDSMSFKSLYQLMTIASISALISKDYLEIEPFVINTYQSLIDHKQKSKQLYYHLHVLYMISNTLFRNKKFETSLEYLNLMKQEMVQNRKKYFNHFKLKYDLLFALNLNYSNQQQDAISYLEAVISKKHQDLEALLDIHLSLITFYFQNNQYKEAYKLFSKFYHTDKWYIEKAGKEWTIKKSLIEILLHLELGNIDLFESRLRSFRRSYSTYLKSIGQKRVLTYLNLIEIYYRNPESVTSEAFIEKVELSFDWIEAKREDIFVMSFYAWLKSKMEKRHLYDTTLHLVQQHRLLN